LQGYRQRKKTEIRQRSEKEKVGPSQKFRLEKANSHLVEPPRLLPNAEEDLEESSPPPIEEETGMEVVAVATLGETAAVGGPENNLEEEIDFLDLPSNPKTVLLLSGRPSYQEHRKLHGAASVPLKSVGPYMGCSRVYMREPRT